MLARIRKAQENEKGFTLIELLVVVIIIGILSAIAIPTFLSQREKAWAKAIRADLHNNAMKMEEAKDDDANGVYPGAGTGPTGEHAFKNSDTVLPTAVVVSGQYGFCLRAVSEKNFGGHGVAQPVANGPATMWFNSRTGKPGNTSCEALTYATPTT